MYTVQARVFGYTLRYIIGMNTYGVIMPMVETNREEPIHSWKNFSYIISRLHHKANISFIIVFILFTCCSSSPPISLPVILVLAIALS